MTCPRCGRVGLRSRDPEALMDCLHCGPVYRPSITAEQANQEVGPKTWSSELVTCPECGDPFGRSGLPSHRSVHRQGVRA